MANRLKMAEIHTIEALWKRGWSCRRIARELGLYRDTVRKYVRDLQSKPATVTPGSRPESHPFSTGRDPPSRRYSPRQRDSCLWARSSAFLRERLGAFFSSST